MALFFSQSGLLPSGRLTKRKGVVASYAPTMGAVALAISALGFAGAANATNEGGVAAIGADTIIRNADGVPATDVAAQPCGISYTNSDGLTLILNNATITVPNTGVSVVGSAVNINAIIVTGTAFNNFTTSANAAASLRAGNGGTAEAATDTMASGAILTTGADGFGVFADITHIRNASNATALLTGGTFNSAGVTSFGVYAQMNGLGNALTQMDGAPSQLLGKRSRAQLLYQ